MFSCNGTLGYVTRKGVLRDGKRQSKGALNGSEPAWVCDLSRTAIYKYIWFSEE